DHRVDIERALVAAQRRLKHDLHEQVAELLAVVGRVIADERVEHFVGLLDKERPQGLEGLLAVPRAPVGGEQAVHDLDQASEGGSGLHTPCYTAPSDVAKQIHREKLAFDDPEALQQLCGSNNSRLKLIERTAGAE